MQFPSIFVSKYIGCVNTKARFDNKIGPFAFITCDFNLNSTPLKNVQLFLLQYLFKRLKQGA
ncbi:hypothetical protein oki361_23550 [Helicobacter pylori]